MYIACSDTSWYPLTYASNARVKSRWSKTFSTVSSDGTPSLNVSLPMRVSISSGTAIPGGMSAAFFRVIVAFLRDFRATPAYRSLRSERVDYR